MTAHTLESLEPVRVNYSTPLSWTATCSCHNPDGDGDGRADFPGMTPLDAVQAWQEHADQQGTSGAEVLGVDGWRVGVFRLAFPLERDGNTYAVAVNIEIPGEDTALSEYLTVEDWDTLRGVR